MKKIFTLITVFLCFHFSVVQAQYNIYVWKGGDLSVMNASQVDSLTFSVGSWLYNITATTPFGVTQNGAKAMVSVSLGQSVKNISETPEVGLCFSADHEQPTYDDDKLVLGSSVGEYMAAMDGCYSGTQYYYRAYVKLLGETFYSGVNTFTTLGSKTYYNINGHSFVDLGLPSGLLWATCNLGASAPEDYGDYFAWGEVSSKQSYSWSNYKWGSGNSFTRYTRKWDTVLFAVDDAAYVNWGDCHIPDAEEFRELFNNCVRTVETINGKSCFKFTGKNDNFIILPAAGNCFDNDYMSGGVEYWTRTLSPKDDRRACSFTSVGGADINVYAYRCYGLPVRPVSRLGK